MLAGAAAAATAAAEDRNVGGGCIDFQANICPVLLRSSGRYAAPTDRSPVEGRERGHGGSAAVYASNVRPRSPLARFLPFHSYS